LPYQARCLDLRSKTDLSVNAALPQEFVAKWIAYYKTSTENPNRYSAVNPNVASHLIRIDQSYLKWLSTVTPDKIGDLKILLRTSRFPAPYWMYTFRDFMLSEGYDGLICNEASEKTPDKNATAYVFYNLDKIGTYEAWHSEPVASGV